MTVFLQHLPHLIPLAVCAVIGALVWRVRRREPAPEGELYPEQVLWPGDLAPVSAPAPGSAPGRSPRRRQRQMVATTIAAALMIAGGLAVLAAGPANQALGAVSIDVSEYLCTATHDAAPPAAALGTALDPS